MNTRLEQVTFLFSYIFRKSMSSSKKIILSTNFGKRIQSHARDVLYEQPTANFKEIVIELEKSNFYKIDFKRSTNKRLINAYTKLCEEKEKQFYSVPLKYSALDENLKNCVRAVIASRKTKMLKKMSADDRRNLAFSNFTRRHGL